MNEAIRLIENYSFNKLKLKRIYAHVLEGNKISARFLERKGFEKEGVLRKSQKIRGRYHNFIVYAKLRR